VDWIAVRKYHDPEPTISYGEEESGSWTIEGITYTKRRRINVSSNEDLTNYSLYLDYSYFFDAHLFISHAGTSFSLPNVEWGEGTPDDYSTIFSNQLFLNATAENYRDIGLFVYDSSMNLVDSKTCGISPCSYTFSLPYGDYLIKARACNDVGCNETNIRSVHLSQGHVLLLIPSPPTPGRDGTTNEHAITIQVNADATPALSNISIKLYNTSSGRELIEEKLCSSSPCILSKTLPDGDYSFDAIACNNMSVCNETNDWRFSIVTGCTLTIVVSNKALVPYYLESILLDGEMFDVEKYLPSNSKVKIRISDARLCKFYNKKKCTPVKAKLKLHDVMNDLDVEQIGTMELYLCPV
jgi:hypothetical protein